MSFGTSDTKLEIAFTVQQSKIKSGSLGTWSHV